MGQFVVVIPTLEIVIVNRVFSGTPSMNHQPAIIREELKPFVKPVSRQEFKLLVELIMEALSAT
jgi:hypothetical protein